MTVSNLPFLFYIALNMTIRIHAHDYREYIHMCLTGALYIPTTIRTSYCIKPNHLTIFYARIQNTHTHTYLPISVPVQHCSLPILAMWCLLRKHISCGTFHSSELSSSMQSSSCSMAVEKTS